MSPDRRRPPRPVGPGTLPEGLVDPRLVPGQPGVGVPELRPGSWRDDGGGDDPNRNRARSTYPPPPVVPPDVPDRPPGVPPTPQGAGRFAADFADGGGLPEPVEPDPAVVAAARRALLAESRAVAECFGGAAPPPLVVQVELDRSDPGAPIGYAGEARRADGEALAEAVELCVLAALDQLTLPAPPTAWGMTVPLGGP